MNFSFPHSTYKLQKLVVSVDVGGCLSLSPRCGCSRSAVEIGELEERLHYLASL